MNPTMDMRGENLIGLRGVRGSQRSLQACDPVSGQTLVPAYAGADENLVDEACELAWRAWPKFRSTALEDRAAFLESIARHIEALGDLLVERAALETALDTSRLRGECGRTTGQLRLFAKLVRSGEFVEQRVDPALPTRTPLPRPELRSAYMSLGPVAVFGASNFPLAFSVAGGDTAAALAAGCPVVVKAHSAHPGTSELVGRAIQAAVRECGMPEGTFSLLFGADDHVGQWLVSHPRIRAVGFTGSRGGGDALMRIASTRAQPIPVFAEMSSVNPVLVFPAALHSRPEQIAAGFVQSMSLGSGQFCTKPGVLFLLGQDGAEAFVAAVQRQLAGRSTGPLLTPRIASLYRDAVSAAAALPGAKVLRGPAAGDRTEGTIFVIDGATFLSDAHWREEMFGPASVVVCLREGEAVAPLLDALDGQLTATLVTDDDDLPMAEKAVRQLETMVGRVVMNGWPTGVEVCDAMVHGGPYPASSDSRFTSVGTLSIRRFLRPVCYQNVAEELLPSWLMQQAQPA